MDAAFVVLVMAIFWASCSYFVMWNINDTKPEFRLLSSNPTIAKIMMLLGPMTCVVYTLATIALIAYTRRWDAASGLQKRFRNATSGG